ncbi:MAG: cytochrome c [Caldilineaceae bacterium]|nr:cytochrome c [Caldilineaceae bacterium]
MLRSFVRFRFLVSGVFLFVVVVAALAWPKSTYIARAQDQGPQSPPYDAGQVTVPEEVPWAVKGRSLYMENCAPCHGIAGLGDGPTAADLPSPPAAFADRVAMWEKSPGMLFHTAKFGRLEKLMPPWANQMSDDEIWNTIAFAWSLHTDQSEVRTGATLYAESCASCHGDGGAGDGPEATATIPDFTDLSYTTFASQADWLAGWQTAHPEVGQEWSVNDQSAALEYIRTFSYLPPWESGYRPGTGVVSGTIVNGTSGTTLPDDLVVALDAYAGFDRIAAFTTTVTAEGTFEFRELALDPDIAYLASTVTGGISYSSDFISLSPDAAQAETTIAVYEGTTDPSALRVNRSHLILDSQPGALIVGQIYTFGNVGDRTYMGQMLEGVDEPLTVALPVPVDAQEISFESGSLGGRFHRVGQVIYDTLPVVPGTDTRQIIVRYAIPYSGTAYDLAQEFVYPVDQLTLLVADLPNLQVDVPSMEFVDRQEIQGNSYLLWRQTGLEPQVINVSMRGLLERGSVDPRAVQGSAGSGAATTAAAVAPPMEAWMIWVMVGSVAVILLGLIGFALRRGTVASGNRRQDLQSLRTRLIEEIAHLDDRHATGELDDDDWLGQRAQLKGQLVEVTRRLGRSPH